MKTILNDLNKDDMFNIMVFDDTAVDWEKEFQPNGKVRENYPHQIHKKILS